MGDTGPWSAGIKQTATSDFVQATDVGCVAACCEILTGGVVTQEVALASLKAPATANAAATFLSSLTASRWDGGYFGKAEHALAFAKMGPMGAVLQAPGASMGHMVVLKPDGDDFLVQDPGNGVVGTVDAQWVMQYVSGGVWVDE